MKKETKNLFLFFILTFLWTWACYAPIAISGNSPYQMPWMILLILGGAGPSIVGVLMVLFTHDKAGRRDFWKRCFSVRRIRLLWWGVIFLGFPLLLLLSVAIDRAMGGSLPAMEQLKAIIANPGMLPLVAFISFMSGPWSEEFGWRGVALDPILKRFGAIPGSLLLGFIWGVWHLPLFFMPATWHGQIGFGVTGFWAFIVDNMGLALAMTWIYKNTNRSILTGMLIHFVSNFSGQLLSPMSEQVFAIRSILLLAAGLACCILYENRTRKRDLLAVESRQAV